MYKKYADKMGIQNLTKELSVIFLKHIKNTLPEIKESITRLTQVTHIIIEKLHLEKRRKMLK